MRGILHLVIELYSLVLFAAVVASWVAASSNHPVKQFLDKVTEPVLEPIRKVLPPMSGIDLSPMVALLLLQVLGRLL